MALTVRCFFTSQFLWPGSKMIIKGTFWSKFQSTFWALLWRYFCKLDTLHSKYSFERNYPQAWIENVEVCIPKQGLNNFNFLHYSAIGERGQRCLWRFHSKDLDQRLRVSSLNKWECSERSLLKGPPKVSFARKSSNYEVMNGSRDIMVALSIFVKETVLSFYCLSHSR